MGAAEATRRALMLATAAAPLAFATPAAAHPDADLLRLGREERALRSTYEAFKDQYYAHCDAVDASAPPLPETLRLTAEERVALKLDDDVVNREALRQVKFMVAFLWHEERWRIRLPAIWRAFEAHEAACTEHRLADTNGALAEAVDRAVDDLAAVEARIAETTATTLDGLHIKARVALANDDRLASERSWSDELLTSVLGDLLAMGEPRRQRELAL